MTPAVFGLAGGRLCLDFANTVHRRPTPAPEERLRGYRDLVAWARLAGLIGAAEARSRSSRAGRAPGPERVVVRKARALREAIYRVFGAIAARRPPSAGDLDTLNAAISAMLAGGRLVPRGGVFVWDWPAGASLGGVLGPVARSVADVLTSADLIRIRQCAAPECGWLFLDTTRNQTRRWCDMTTCGNRAKARRFYARRLSGRRRAGGRSAPDRPEGSRSRRGARARPRP